MNARDNRRRAIRRRIEARSPVVGCPHPEKPAYDPHDPDEQRMQQRRLGPGLEPYLCRCGYSHNGHCLEVRR